MSTEELKPCPFCGGEAEKSEDGFFSGFARCKNACTGMMHIETWNMRTDYHIKEITRCNHGVYPESSCQECKRENKSNLFPCPMDCDSDIHSQDFIVGGVVWCGKCFIKMVRSHSGDKYDGKRKAIKAWNTRKEKK